MPKTWRYGSRLSRKHMSRERYFYLSVYLCYMYTYAHINARTRMSVIVCLYMHVYLCMYVRLACRPVGLYVCMYVWTEIYSSWHQVLRSDHPRAVHGSYHPFQQTGRAASRTLSPKTQDPKTQNPASNLPKGSRPHKKAIVNLMPYTFKSQP